MSLVLAIMDRNNWSARTDVMVIVNPTEKTLSWIPRDLYCKTIDNRINAVYRKGQELLFLSSLQKLGYQVQHCVCMLPDVVNACIQQMPPISIPLYKTIGFEYPLHRHEPIENGKRIITFRAPVEKLSGDRIHEFIGARYSIRIGSENADQQKKQYKKYYMDTGHPNYAQKNGFPDFNRMRRQQILVKEWLNTHANTFHFTIPHDPEKIKGLNETTISILKKIDQTWVLQPISETEYNNIIINGNCVLHLSHLKRPF